MAERMVKFSDLSGEMINPDDLVGIVITDHPDLDEARRIEVRAQEIENLGRYSIQVVGLQVTRVGDEEPSRHFMTVNNFNKLSTRRPMEEVLADAQPVVQPKAQRRSHSTTKDGGPLINYNDPEYAGLPHKGKVGEQEAEFVRNNLELVNERRTTAGHAPIDPTNALDARRYGLQSAETDTGGS